MDGWLVAAPQRAKQWGAQAVLPDSVLDEKRKWARSPGGSRLGKMSQSDVIHVIGVSISTQPMAADGLISKAACETGGCWSGRGPRRQARDSARSARDARRIAGGRRPRRSSRPALAPDSLGRSSTPTCPTGPSGGARNEVSFDWMSPEPATRYGLVTEGMKRHS